MHLNWYTHHCFTHTHTHGHCMLQPFTSSYYTCKLEILKQILYSINDGKLFSFCLPCLGEILYKLIFSNRFAFISLVHFFYWTEYMTLPTQRWNSQLLGYQIGFNQCFNLLHQMSLDCASFLNQNIPNSIHLYIIDVSV